MTLLLYPVFCDWCWLFVTRGGGGGLFNFAGGGGGGEHQVV